MVENKPAPPIGDMIPDSAWLLLWDTHELGDLSSELMCHYSVRVSNHGETYTALASSAANYMSEAINEGHEKTRSLLHHDHSISESFADTAGIIGRIADTVQTARSHMITIATEATEKVQQLNASGNFSAAEQVKDSARDEITSLGDELAVDIRNLLGKITIPELK